MINICKNCKNWHKDGENHKCLNLLSPFWQKMMPEGDNCRYFKGKDNDKIISKQ